MQKLRPFLSRSSNPLTAADSCLHLSSGVKMAGRRARAHVLARALCRFRYIPFGELPMRERAGHLEVQLAAWAPFAAPAFAIAMREEGAAVFAWDQAAFAQRCEAAGIGAGHVRVLPETLLHPPLDEGVALRRCIEGWEGQVWRGGMLRTSRWWAQAPDAESWLNFQRGAGLSPVELPPLPADEEAAEPAWSGQPWAEAKSLAALKGEKGFKLMAALAAALLLFALPTAWLANELWHAGERVAALAAQKRQLEEAARPVLQAREESLQILANLEGLTKRVDHVGAVALLAHLSRRLPRDGSVVRELEWSGSKLRLALAAPAGTSRIAYVQALEGGGWLREVRELGSEQGGGEGLVVLSAEIAGLAPVAMAAPAQPASPAAAAPAPAAGERK